jgi:hypothetical protein
VAGQRLVLRATRPRRTSSASASAHGRRARRSRSANLEDTGDTFGVGLRGSSCPSSSAASTLLYSKNVQPVSREHHAGRPPGRVPDRARDRRAIARHHEHADAHQAARDVCAAEELRAALRVHSRASGRPTTGAGCSPTARRSPTARPPTARRSRRRPKQNADWLAVRYIYRFQ